MCGYSWLSLWGAEFTSAPSEGIAGQENRPPKGSVSRDLATFPGRIDQAVRLRTRKDRGPRQYDKGLYQTCLRKLDANTVAEPRSTSQSGRPPDPLFRYEFGAGGGTRTHTPHEGTTDFKSAFLEASAASSVHQMCPQFRSLNQFEPQT